MAITERGTMSYEVERVMRTIFKRCLDCPDQTPTCPSCNSNQICSLVPYDCNACAHMICVDNPTPSPAASSGPNVGAIAGGVVGGVAFVGIIVFLVWRFWIRKRRAQQEAEAEEWEEDEIERQKAAFQNMHHDTASTRTRGSLAHSILSRASNVIQIAYIPGVTNRHESGQDSTLGGSPVPPVPAARSTPRSPLSNKDDALFFRPSDIRDSSYSDTSTIDGRRDTRYTRASLSPSLASGIFPADSTIEPVPATQISRVQPKMVSVKSSATSPNESPNVASPVSAADHSQFAANAAANQGKQVQILMPAQGPKPSIGSSLRARAQQITVGGKKKGRFPIRSGEDSSTTLVAGKHAPTVSSPLAEENHDTEDDDEDEHARARRSLLNPTRDGNLTPSTTTSESPFFDATESPIEVSGSKQTSYAPVSTQLDSPKRSRGVSGLNAVIEEATRKASSTSSQDTLRGKRDTGPFSDEHQLE